MPAAAQDGGPLPADLTSASAIASAATSLAEMVQDKLLIRDLLGKEITGSNGDRLGTVENLAVIPGGRIVAAIVSTDGGTRIAVPYTAIKVTRAAEQAQLQAKVPASELTGMSELSSLADSLGK
jgi:ribosomal 30S subunit maturation factor RimM